MTKQQIVSMFKNRLGIPSGYYQHYIENALPMVQESDFVDDFKRGAGHELFPKSGKPKFCSIVSSSALVVNAFAPWKKYRDILSIDLGDEVLRDFSEIKFEEKILNGLKGTPPHLDVWLSSSETIVGIESKFTELFDAKKKVFSDQYGKYIQRNKTDFYSSPWTDFIEHESLAEGYRYLDVVQLVKHYFGLKRYKKTFNPKKTIYLLYLYWYPDSYKLKDDIVYTEHNRELDRFSEYVKTDLDIIFKHMNYGYLYKHWAEAPINDEIRAHLEAFRQRYLIL
jgi:hypothetical protein